MSDEHLLINPQKDATAPLAVMIATPCYGGMVSAEYMRSVMAWNALAQSLGIMTAVFTISSSLIASARNDCVAVFRQNAPFTDLLFIDADIVFDPQAVLAFLKHPAPVLGGVCALKNIEWSEIGTAARNGVPDEQLPLYGVRTNIGANTKDDRVDFKPEADGTFVIEKIGTGFMRIKRRVFDELERFSREDHLVRLGEDPFVKAYRVAPGTGPQSERTEFFQTKVTSGEFRGEDFFFCDLLQRAGIELRAHSKFRFGHIGNHMYVAGNLG